MKSTSKTRTTAATASSAVAKSTNSSGIVAVSATTSAQTTGDSETVSRTYQAQVLGITIFGVVGFVVFIKYVVTKYFAELEANYQQQQHSEF